MVKYDESVARALLILGLEQCTLLGLLKNSGEPKDGAASNAAYGKLCGIVTSLELIGDQEAANAIENQYAFIYDLMHLGNLSMRKEK